MPGIPLAAGLLQLLFTLVTLALAVATYHSVEAAVAWQVGASGGGRVGVLWRGSLRSAISGSGSIEAARTAMVQSLDEEGWAGPKPQLHVCCTMRIPCLTRHVPRQPAAQVVKLLLPLYLGAVHTCERAPVQELRAAAAQMAAAGLLAAPAAEALRAEALRAEAAGKHRVEGKARGKVE